MISDKNHNLRNNYYTHYVFIKTIVYYHNAHCTSCTLLTIRDISYRVSLTQIQTLQDHDVMGTMCSSKCNSYL